MTTSSTTSIIPATALRASRHSTPLMNLAWAGLALASLLTAAPVAQAQTYHWANFAGSTGGAGDIDGKAPARFRDPKSVAVDSAGNVYVAEPASNTIRKITPSGTVSTFAGVAGEGGSTDSTPGMTGKKETARFYQPSGIAVDSTGNVYVTDNFTTIRKITPAGVVSTLAGIAGFYGNADGTGSAARFSYPEGLAVDSAGNVYVADSNNDTIRKITPAGVVSTLAGSAAQSGSADGQGSAARFFNPQGVALDSSGNLYVSDTYNYTIRKITPHGKVSTLAGQAGVFGDKDGKGSHAQFEDPTGVAVDSAGNVYVTDSTYDTIRKITSGGDVTTFAGSPQQFGSADGTGGAARFGSPEGVAVDSAGNLYVADTGNETIRQIPTTGPTPGAVTTFAGLAAESGSADGKGARARFDLPNSVAVDSTGNVYVADTQNHTIRKITPTGQVSTFAGTAGHFGSADGIGSAAQFNGPSGVAVDSAGNVFVADTQNLTIRKITPAGVVSTFAGLANNYGSTDGVGSAARFAYPEAVAVDSANHLVYVADTNSSTIRKITTAGATPGTVTTLAGSPGLSGNADGTGSAARFSYPAGVAVDSAGNVYVADTDNDRIREVTPGGVVTTISVTGNPLPSFAFPNGVAVDAAGNIYVADTDHYTVRMIGPGGAVTTIGGTGKSDMFYGPTSVAIDSSSGKIYVADPRNNHIAVGTP